jgi:hypothetical protein
MRKADLWIASIITMTVVFVILLMLAGQVRWSDGPTYFWVEFANLIRNGGLLLALLIFPIVLLIILGLSKLTGR